MKSLLRNHIITGKVCCSDRGTHCTAEYKKENVLPFSCCGSTKMLDLPKLLLT